MWNSSLSYQLRPNCDVPLYQFSVEKSSVYDDNVARVFAFAFVLPFRLAKRAFAFELLFAFALLLLLLLMLASAMIRINPPIPMNKSTAPIPRIHGQRLRFCGAIGGIGDHCGGGVDGGCGGICPGP